MESTWISTTWITAPSVIIKVPSPFYVNSRLKINRAKLVRAKSRNTVVNDNVWCHRATVPHPSLRPIRRIIVIHPPLFHCAQPARSHAFKWLRPIDSFLMVCFCVLLWPILIICSSQEKRTVSFSIKYQTLCCVYLLEICDSFSLELRFRCPSSKLSSARLVVTFLCPFPILVSWQESRFQNAWFVPRIIIKNH